MDRRQFIQSASVLGASATLPLSASGAAGTVSARGVPRFAVIAVGGIGRSVLGDLSPNLPDRPRTIAINTDAAGLGFARADRKILVGDGVDRYRPVRPDAAARLARSVKDDISAGISDLDMAFLVVGMGGAAGTGISPVVAEVLQQHCVLTLAYTISPFDWESPQRRQTAASGIQALRPFVDGLISVSNERIAQAAGDDALASWSLAQAPLDFWQRFRKATNLARAWSGVTDWEEIKGDLRNMWV